MTRFAHSCSMKFRICSTSISEEFLVIGLLLLGLAFNFHIQNDQELSGIELLRSFVNLAEVPLSAASVELPVFARGVAHSGTLISVAPLSYAGLRTVTLRSCQLAEMEGQYVLCAVR
jgi:hypothetical protein